MSAHRRAHGHAMAIRVLPFGICQPQRGSQRGLAGREQCAAPGRAPVVSGPITLKEGARHATELAFRPLCHFVRCVRSSP